MERFLERITVPVVGYTVAAIIVLAIILHHYRQMALIRSGLIKKYGIRRWRIDRDTLFGGLVLLMLGGSIVAAKYYNLSIWLAFWGFVALLGVNLIIRALTSWEHRHSSRD